MPAAGAGNSSVSSWSLYRRLLGYAYPHWKIFLIATVAMAAFAMTDTGFAALMQPMLDESFVARDPHLIRLIPVLLIGLFVLRGVTGFVSDYGMMWVGRRIVQQLRGEMFRHLLRLPVAFYEASSTGQLTTRLIYHVEQVSQASTSSLTILIRDSLTVAFLVAWMFYVSGWLAALFLVTAPVMSILVWHISRRFRHINRRLQNSMVDVTQVAEEVIEGQRIVKTFAGEGAETRKFEAINNKNRTLQMKLTATSAASAPTVQLIAASTLAIVIYLATREEVAATISPGQFVSFLAAMLLLLPPLKRLTTVNAALQKGLAAAESIFALLDSEMECDRGKRTLQRSRGEIEYRDVSFRYPSAQTEVMSHLSFDIKPGETVALVGRSGCGKSTIAHLLPRFYDPQDGCILLDGRDLRDYRLTDLRNQIGLVGQDVRLFNDSIAHNIAYGQLAAASREEIIQAAEAAHAMDFIRELPQGLDTIVGQHGIRLSGGQRQRIAIARALLKNAPILILDEATAALDAESERSVQAGLARLMHKRTTLVIAHRLSTVEHADCILVLDRGTIVESGQHAALLARDGLYAALYRLQFQD
jgi:subfamily B ATP-binding cassette protein MsbA